MKLADLTPGLEVQARYNSGRGAYPRKATVLSVPDKGDGWVPCNIELPASNGAPVMRRDTIWYTQIVRPWADAQAEAEAHRAEAEARAARQNSEMRAAYQAARDTVAAQLDQLTATGLFTQIRPAPDYDGGVKLTLDARDISLWAALVAYSVTTEDPSRADETALIDLIVDDALGASHSTPALVAALRGDHTPYRSSFGCALTVEGLDQINQLVQLVTDFVTEHPDKVAQLRPTPPQEN